MDGDKEQPYKPKLVRLLREDEARIEYIRRRSGVRNRTDIIRLALAELAEKFGYRGSEPEGDGQTAPLK